jgi:hypothetical protein
MLRRVAALSALGLLLSLSSVTPQAKSNQPRGVDVVGSLVAPLQGSAAGYSLPLRNIDTGEVVTRAVSGPSGEFSYAAVPQGVYVVEARNAAGRLVGTSAPIVALESRPLTPISLAIAPPLATQNSLVMSAASVSPAAASIIYAALLERIAAASAFAGTRRPPSAYH